MYFHNGLKVPTQKSKGLGAAFGQRTWAFCDGHLGTTHILVCQHSWNTCRIFFWGGGGNISVLTKIFKPLRNWVVPQESCTQNEVEMCLECTPVGRKTIMITKKNLPDERTMLITPTCHGNWTFPFVYKIRSGMTITHLPTSNYALYKCHLVFVIVNFK